MGRGAVPEFLPVIKRAALSYDQYIEKNEFIINEIANKSDLPEAKLT